MRLSLEQMLDDAYLAERARLIDPKRAQVFSHGHAPRGGTIYLTTPTSAA
jgi:gamma-glutamyltranspeptidase/glutathione hydrolase